VQLKENIYLLCRVSVDADNIEYDDIEVDVLLNRHMPEILPIKGNRIKFYYPGIKPLCIRCYTSGHNKWECSKKEKTNWLDFVIKFYKSDEVNDDMLGSWVETLKTFHPELNKRKPIWGNHNEDLRDNIEENKAYDRRQTNARSRGRARGRGRGRGRERGQTSFENPQSQPHVTTYIGKPRGRGRGRGLPRRGNQQNY